MLSSAGGMKMISWREAAGKKRAKAHPRPPGGLPLPARRHLLFRCGIAKIFNLS